MLEAGRAGNLAARRATAEATAMSRTVAGLLAPPGCTWDCGPPVKEHRANPYRKALNLSIATPAGVVLVLVLLCDPLTLRLIGKEM